VGPLTKVLNESLKPFLLREKLAFTEDKPDSTGSFLKLQGLSLPDLPTPEDRVLP
jgi:hypothetical protein